MIEYLLEKVTDFIVVGAPAFTFLKVVQKMEVGVVTNKLIFKKLLFNKFKGIVFFFIFKI